MSKRWSSSEPRSISTRTSRSAEPHSGGLLRAGQVETAIAETGKPLRMSPMDSFAGIYTAIHGLALLGARRFTDALPFLRSSAAFAGYPGHYNALISCCGHLGLKEEVALG